MREDSARLVLVKEGERQTVQLVGDGAAQAVVDVFGEACHEKALQKVERAHAEVDEQQHENVPAAVCPGGREARARGICRPDLCPQKIDHARAAEGGVDGQHRVAHDGEGDNREPRPLVRRGLQKAAERRACVLRGREVVVVVELPLKALKFCIHGSRLLSSGMPQCRSRPGRSRAALRAARCLPRGRPQGRRCGRRQARC